MHDTLEELLYRVITLDTNARATVPTPAQSLDESTITVEESMISLDDAVLLQERPATPPLPPPPVDDNPVAVSPVNERLDVLPPVTPAEEAKLPSPRRRRTKKRTKKTKKVKRKRKRKRKKKPIEQMERDENTVSDERVQQAVIDAQLCCATSLCGPKCCIL